MSRQLHFTDFSDAFSFLKKIQIGKVQRKPNTDLYIWESEHASLSEEQKSIIEEADGSKFVWTDSDTTLTWLLKDHGMHVDIERLNSTSYGHHDDWRMPTLRELKTLSSNKKNRFGSYVKESLEGRISGNYRSCTTYFHWQEQAWWSFDEGKSTTEKYSEGKIQWGSDGTYAGFEQGRQHNSARAILVRGSDASYLSDWATRLRDWSESYSVFDFPVTQKSIEEIETLTLPFAKLLPADLSRLPRLKHLTCYSHAGIEDTLFSITGLQELVLERSNRKEQGLEEIPASVRNLRHLVSLEARRLGLKKIHEAIGSLSRLQSLDLGANKIESVPESIGDLSELRSLNLSMNYISAVPSSIGQLKKLEKLSIGGHFDRLPESIGDLAQLTEIVIRSDKLTEIPKSFRKLTKLQRLVCTGPVRDFSRLLEKLESLKMLTIESTYLETIPNDVFAMPWLHTLIITNSPIKRIPDEISGLTSLERLDLSGTQIAELPKSMLLLENLRFLDISSTQLDTLPEWLNDMKSLSRIAGKGVKFPKVLIEKKAYTPGEW